MDDVAIRFELRALNDVVPWGDEQTGLRLHWFGLTDGWYDVVIGGHRLYSCVDDVRGIDYQVVRLWEDLIEVAPSALESIPESLAARLADIDAWMLWVEKVCDLDDHRDLVSVALQWWFWRGLSASHLVGAPTLHLWCYGDELRIHWRSSPRGPDGPVWSSPNGDAITSANAFRELLLKFDRDLFAAMEARVESVAKNWSRPEIEIDAEALRREQADRATWLQRALNTPRFREHGWTETIDAVIELERLIGGVITQP